MRLYNIFFIVIFLTSSTAYSLTLSKKNLNKIQHLILAINSIITPTLSEAFFKINYGCENIKKSRSEQIPIENFLLLLKEYIDNLKLISYPDEFQAIITRNSQELSNIYEKYRKQLPSDPMECDTYPII